jgi:hypothetical protein
MSAAGSNGPGFGLGTELDKALARYALARGAPDYQRWKEIE